MAAEGAEPALTAQSAGDAVRQVAAGRPGVIARRWLGLATLAALALFALDAVLVETMPLLPFDLPVAHAVQAFPWGPWVAVFDATNRVAGLWQTALGAGVVLAVLAFERRAGYLMALGAIASLMDQVIKSTVGRHRPTTDLVSVLSPVNGYSFPSGHAVFYTWLFLMLAFAAAPHLSRWPRRAAWTLALLMSVSACLGRVYAGAHWPSDVLGGFLLAVAWSTFVLWLPERALPYPAALWTGLRGAGRRRPATGPIL